MAAYSNMAVIVRLVCFVLAVPFHFIAGSESGVIPVSVK